ncbi:MAG: Ig-like domain-containing protein, partial [Planctomycetes bacterium]|nr:Ig-like domain-containing protein [Planctomycetota bacterium]
MSRIRCAAWSRWKDGVINAFSRSGIVRRRNRNRFRRQIIEQLETRTVMTLSILSVSPLDGSTNVPLTSDLIFTFNQAVVKGQGNIYVVREGTGTTGVAVDVRSSSVTISGAQVTVDLPVNLEVDNSYFVHIDSGAFLDTSSTSTPNATLLTQSFDFLPLGPKVFEANGTGNDWTATPPLGFESRLDNPSMAGVGVPEWRGWTFARKEFWIGADNQGRDQFALGNGTLAIADTDEYDDGLAAVRPFQSTLITKPVSLAGVAPNSVKLEFDSSFRPEDSQIGRLSVSYDGGTNWTQLLELNPTNTDNDAPFAKKNINERLVTGLPTGGGVAIGAVNNPSSGTLLFRFYTEGGNDWWWALDDLLITGAIVGVPFAGLSDKTFWNFSTPESPKLSLSINKEFMSENGGTAIGTVSRNNLPTGDVVVTLASSDTTEATVPATVTIPNGQSSVTFPITAVDDLLSDRTQTVTITATSAAYASASATIRVTDDEGPKIVSLVPADNASNVNYKSNFSITFDTNVKKGTGSIYIVDSTSNAAAEQIDVTSPAVTISNATVTIDPSINLFGLRDYYVLIDDGALLSTVTDLTPNTILHRQTFDRLPLRPFTTEPNGDGTDFTKTPPLGYVVDNSLMPASNSDFHGWVFMDKNSWIATEGDQSRSRFTFGSGVVAVADSDAWDDTPHAPGRMNTFLRTPAIDLAGITPGSVVLEFDSSYYPELPQFGELEVSYNGGTTWTKLLFFGDANNTNEARNNKIVLSSTNTAGQFIGGATVVAPLVSPATGSMVFRFAYLEGDNNWWWAVDNVVVRGERSGVPFAGIDDPTVWNVRTAEAPTLTVTIDRAAMSENGGTAVGTVSRNLSTTGALTVTLSSNDTTEATVPATVTIPDGQASITFPITAVDDTLPDGPQTVLITASLVDYFSVSASIRVDDDDFPKILSITPVDNATGVDVSANIVVRFDQPIRKGNGLIYLVRSEDSKAGISIDVNSSQVTIAGDTMTINPSIDLQRLRDYSIRIDRGSVLSTLPTISIGTTLLTQDFELVPLSPAILELNGLTANGRDFSATPPEGWNVSNSA